MKNVSKFNKPLLFISMVLAVVLLSACEDNKYPVYLLATKELIPNEDKQKCTDFISKTVSSASFHMTTSDYEDPEDVLLQAERTAFNLYSKEIQGLRIEPCKGCSYDFIELSEFSDYQKLVYDSLQNNR